MGPDPRSALEWAVWLAQFESERLVRTYCEREHFRTHLDQRWPERPQAGWVLPGPIVPNTL